MIEHPWFVFDEDDEYDNTYADFYFIVPLDEISEDAKNLLIEVAQEPVDNTKRWLEAIRSLEED